MTLQNTSYLNLDNIVLHWTDRVGDVKVRGHFHRVKYFLEELMKYSIFQIYPNLEFHVFDTYFPIPLPVGKDVITVGVVDTTPTVHYDLVVSFYKPDNDTIYHAPWFGGIEYVPISYDVTTKKIPNLVGILSNSPDILKDCTTNENYRDMGFIVLHDLPHNDYLEGIALCEYVITPSSVRAYESLRYGCKPILRVDAVDQKQHFDYLIRHDYGIGYSSTFSSPVHLKDRKFDKPVFGDKIKNIAEALLLLCEYKTGLQGIN